MDLNASVVTVTLSYIDEKRNPPWNQTFRLSPPLSRSFGGEKDHSYLLYRSDYDTQKAP